MASHPDTSFTDNAMSISPSVSPDMTPAVEDIQVVEGLRQTSEPTRDPSEVISQASQRSGIQNKSISLDIKRLENVEELDVGENRPSSETEKSPMLAKLCATANTCIDINSCVLNPWGKLPPLGQTHTSGTAKVYEEGKDYYIDSMGNPHRIREPSHDVISNLMEYGVLPSGAYKCDIKTNALRRCQPRQICELEKEQCRLSCGLGPPDSQGRRKKKKKLIDCETERSGHPYPLSLGLVAAPVPGNDSCLVGRDDVELDGAVDPMPSMGGPKLPTCDGGMEYELVETGLQEPIKKNWSHLLSPGTGSKREPTPFPHFLDRTTASENTMERCRNRANAAEEFVEIKREQFVERYMPYQRLPRSSKKRKGANKKDIAHQTDCETTRVPSSDKSKHKIRERRDRAKTKRLP